MRAAWLAPHTPLRNLYVSVYVCGYACLFLCCTVQPPPAPSHLHIPEPRKPSPTQRLAPQRALVVHAPRPHLPGGGQRHGVHSAAHHLHKVHARHVHLQVHSSATGIHIGECGGALGAALACVRLACHPIKLALGGVRRMANSPDLLLHASIKRGAEVGRLP